MRIGLVGIGVGKGVTVDTMPNIIADSIVGNDNSKIGVRVTVIGGGVTVDTMPNIIADNIVGNGSSTGNPSALSSIN